MLCLPIAPRQEILRTVQMSYLSLILSLCQFHTLLIFGNGVMWILAHSGSVKMILFQFLSENYQFCSSKLMLMSECEFWRTVLEIFVHNCAVCCFHFQPHIFMLQLHKSSSTENVGLIQACSALMSGLVIWLKIATSTDNRTKLQWLQATTTGEQRMNVLWRERHEVVPWKRHQPSWHETQLVNT